MQLSKRKTRHHIACLPFSRCETRVIRVCLPSTCPRWYTSLVPPHLIELMITSLPKMVYKDFEDLKQVVLYAVLLALGMHFAR
jgi:hypothetical protein